MQEQEHMVIVMYENLHISIFRINCFDDFDAEESPYNGTKIKHNYTHNTTLQSSKILSHAEGKSETLKSTRHT
jgi:hypothetical protein